MCSKAFDVQVSRPQLHRSGDAELVLVGSDRAVFWGDKNGSTVKELVCAGPHSVGHAKLLRLISDWPA